MALLLAAGCASQSIVSVQTAAPAAASPSAIRSGGEMQPGRSMVLSLPMILQIKKLFPSAQVLLLKLVTAAQIWLKKRMAEIGLRENDSAQAIQKQKLPNEQKHA